MKIILGVTGLSGSGKDTVAEYLKSKGFVTTSLSDRIREECGVRGLPLDRDTLICVGNELRENFGLSVLAERSQKIIKNSENNKFVLTSIRHPKEVEFLKAQGNFWLLEIFVPLEIRFERIKSRLREGDQEITLEKFKEQEARELSGSEAQQQLLKVMDLADFRIDNSGSLEETKKQVEEILEKINQ
jgi:dephospho-CoA kinase